ncbi:MAG: helix-turn-helix domain-containing protein [Syntrophomonadaceae bacterium]|nr:helix-turn-helix domain-containing protein [Syntrophomonadaceae bacterium]
MPSMREMATELGIDYDELIESFSEDRTPQEMATKFDISNEMAANLKEHYYKFGISSVMGGD